MEPYTIIYKDVVDVIETSCAVAPPFRMESFKHLYGLMSAIWDTGAKVSTIDWSIADAVGQVVNKSGRVRNVSGISEAHYSRVDILIPGGEIITDTRVMVGNIGQWKMLIGMDVIKRGDFAVTNYDGHTAMSFRIPSEGRIDFTNKAEI